MEPTFFESGRWFSYCTKPLWEATIFGFPFFQHCIAFDPSKTRNCYGFYGLGQIFKMPKNGKRKWKEVECWSKSLHRTSLEDSKGGPFSSPWCVSHCDSGCDELVPPSQKVSVVNLWQNWELREPWIAVSLGASNSMGEWKNRRFTLW